MLIHHILVLNPLSPPPKKKILRKERDHRLRAEEIAAALARQAKSSIDQKNFENWDLKIKLLLLKAKEKSLSVYSQLYKISRNHLK